MPSLPPKHRPVVRRMTAAPNHDEQRRGSSTSRGYDSKWSRVAKAYKAKHPLCVQCQTLGRIVASTDVDHIVPHGLKAAIDSGDVARIERARRLFWDSRNWQALCAPCHSAKTAREDGGFGNSRFDGRVQNVGRESET